MHGKKIITKSRGNFLSRESLILNYNDNKIYSDTDTKTTSGEHSGTVSFH